METAVCLHLKCHETQACSKGWSKTAEVLVQAMARHVRAGLGHCWGHELSRVFHAAVCPGVGVSDAVDVD
jgi:hypothetical protein